MWYNLLKNYKEIFFVSSCHTHEHMTHLNTLCFFFKSLKLNTLLCFSLEFHFRNANALGPDTPWFISSFIFPHICLCPCVCLLLIPPLFQPVCLPWDLGLPHLPHSALSHTCLCAYIYTHEHKLAYRKWEPSLAVTVAAPWRYHHCPTSYFAWGPSNPICLWPRTERPCTESISNLYAVGAGCRSLWWCITGSQGKWPDSCTCFLSTKITLRQERNGSPGQTNLPLYVLHSKTGDVQDRIKLCFSCQKWVWITAGLATTPPRSEVSYLHSIAMK